MASPAECLDRFVTPHYPASYSAEYREEMRDYLELFSRSFFRSSTIIFFIMPGERYCEPCKRLLCGKLKPLFERAWEMRFIHHPDANSLKEALSLPCVLCSFAWNEKTFSLPWRESISDITTGVLLIHDNDLELQFLLEYSNDFSIRFWLVPCGDMTFYEFPSLLSDNARSIATLDFLRSKYQECRDEHVGCRLQPAPMAIYPSRIIDVGEPEDDRIHLRDTQDLSNREEYTCLSHCWGQKQPLLLTKESKSMLQDGVLVSALPKTFQDAVLVTRSLGIRFLWIDSLCIFQDNDADWSIEAGHMGGIYSQAACTIAATAAEDSDGGLFTESNTTILQRHRIETTWTPDPNAVENGTFVYPQAGIYWCEIDKFWNEDVERATLNSRAWVCQERHLSSRIMHFSRTHLFWECHEGTACESYPSGLPTWAGPFWREDSSLLKQGLYQLRRQEANMSSEGSEVRRSSITIPNTRPLLERELYFYWAVFRIRYTECALTKEEDKLIAINGIAKQLGKTLGDQLIAGLWYHCLLEELCWFKLSYANDSPPRKVTNWRAPTWSWASSNARIWVSDTTRVHRSCKNRQVWGKLEDVDVKAKASGELENASLRIQCKPICAVIESQTSIGYNARYKVVGVLTFQNSKVSIQVKGTAFDITMDDSERQEIRYVHMIIIQRCPHHPRVRQNVDNGDDEDSEADWELSDCIEGLLLVPRHDCDDVFERVGLFTAKGIYTVAKVLEEYEAADSRIITLV